MTVGFIPGRDNSFRIFGVFLFFLLNLHYAHAEVKGSPSLSIDPSRRLVIEIHTASNCRPNQKVVEEVMTQLRELMPGREIIVSPIVTIPEEQRPNTWSKESSAVLAEKFLRQFPDEKTEVLFVQWVPHAPEKGLAGQETGQFLLRRGADWFLLPGFVLFCDAFPEDRLATRYGARLEKMVFLHETGHLLGLPASDHRLDHDPFHCKTSSCIMAGIQGSVARYLAGRFLHLLPKTFCPVCREALRKHEKARLRRADTPEQHSRDRQAVRGWNSAAAGSILAEWGRVDAAIDLLEAERKENPIELAPRRVLAQLLLNRGRATEALTEVRWIARQPKEGVWACGSNTQLIQSLVARGFYRAAASLTDGCGKDLRPDFNPWQMTLWARVGSGRFDEAFEQLTDAIADNSLGKWPREYAWEDAVRVACYKGDWERAAHQIEGKEFWSYRQWRLKAWIDRSLGRSPEVVSASLMAALKLATRTEKKDHDMRDIDRATLALIWAQLGEKEKARDWLTPEKLEICRQSGGSACASLLVRAFILLGDEGGRDFWLNELAKRPAWRFMDDPCLDPEFRKAVPDSVLEVRLPRCVAEDRLLPEVKPEPD